jgi:hypothetical protein
MVRRNVSAAAAHAPLPRKAKQRGAAAQELPDLNKASLRNGEDLASLPAKEVTLQFRLSSAAAPAPTGCVSAMHFCPFSDHLACGHVDGRVSIWRVADDASAPELRVAFLAHRGGGVTSLVTTQWGALWTGCTTGSLRLWPQAMADACAARRVPEQLAAVGGCEARRGAGERAHGKVTHLARCEGGQVRCASDELRGLRLHIAFCRQI